MAQVAEFGSPPPLFVITGGDPFQRPDLFELVRHGTRPACRSRSPRPARPRSPGRSHRTGEAGARAVSLSLDGSDARVHDAFRATPGVYRWTLDAWQAARDLGLKVQINTTVTGHNLTDLPEIVRIVRQMGALTWSAFLLVPTGRGRLLSGLDPHQVEDVLNFVYDAGAFVPARTTEAHHFRRIAIQRAILSRAGGRPRGRSRPGPAVPDTAAPVDRTRSPRGGHAARPWTSAPRADSPSSPTGAPCTPAASCPLRRQRPPRPADRHLPDLSLFTGLRDPGNLTGRCGACEFRTICGGSRSRAQATSGDPYAEEPWCAYEPGSFPYEDELASYGVKTVR